MGLFSVLGNLAGSFFPGPGNIIGSALGGALDDRNARRDAENTNSANAAQTRLLRQTAYQDTVGDLKSAGLNPMMAYTNGATSAQAQPMQNVGEAAARQTMSSAQTANLQADTANKAAQAEQIQAQTDLLKAQTLNTGAQTANIEATLPKIIEEVQALKWDNMTGEDRVRMKRHEVTLIQIEQDLKKGLITKQEAETRTQNVITQLKRYEIPGAKNLADFERLMDTGGGNASKAAGAVGTTINTVRKVLGK